MTMETLTILRYYYHITQVGVVDVGVKAEEGLCRGGGRGEVRGKVGGKVREGEERSERERSGRVDEDEMKEGR